MCLLYLTELKHKLLAIFKSWVQKCHFKQIFADFDIPLNIIILMNFCGLYMVFQCIIHQYNIMLM